MWPQHQTREGDGHSLGAALAFFAAFSLGKLRVPDRRRQRFSMGDAGRRPGQIILRFVTSTSRMPTYTCRTQWETSFFCSRTFPGSHQGAHRRRTNCGSRAQQRTMEQGIDMSMPQACGRPRRAHHGADHRHVHPADRGSNRCAHPGPHYDVYGCTRQVVELSGDSRRSWLRRVSVSK